NWQILNVIRRLPPLCHALFYTDSFLLIAFENRDTFVPQKLLEPISPGIASAANIDDPLHTIGNCVFDHLVIIFCSRNQIVVEGLLSKFGELCSTDPRRA